MHRAPPVRRGPLWNAGGGDYDNAIDALTAWAKNDENVRAMVMTGSAAAHETHALSDRDIEIYATNPGPLLVDNSWWDHLGDVLVVERLATPRLASGPSGVLHRWQAGPDRDQG